MSAKKKSLCGARYCPGHKRCLACHAAYMRAWRHAHPERYSRAVRARKLAGHALRRGTLTRMPCERCGNPNAEMHHPNYDQPYRVRWLCRRHHLALHGVRMNPQQRRRPMDLYA